MVFLTLVIALVGILGLVHCEDDNFVQESLDYPIPVGYRLWDDMILPESFFNQSDPNWSRNAINNPNLKWPRAIVPYFIDNSLSHHRNNIHQAMNEYHAKTCVRFVPRNNEHNYVNIFSGSGCFSLIGRTGQGSQPLSLGRGCTDHGTIVHELGHAIGFHHEQNRSDRDNHLIINWGNIQQGYASQFNALSPGQNWLINGFDVNSIMLYGATAFSKDGYSQTMVHRGGQRLIEVYQKRGLSYADVQRVNKLYGC